ncbi:MAG: hypothetical protein EBX50_19220 [Chitinophagia bacterium]|nr:hypothetical protein [Chitinophagia bacterium]
MFFLWIDCILLQNIICYSFAKYSLLFCYNLIDELDGKCSKKIFKNVLLYSNAVWKSPIYSFLGILLVYKFI